MIERPYKKDLELQEKRIRLLSDKTKRFRVWWIKNNKCEHVAQVLPHHVLNCDCVRKAIRERFKREEDEVWSWTVDIGKKLLEVSE